MALFVLFAAAATAYYVWSGVVHARLVEEWEYEQGFASQKHAAAYEIAKGGHGDKHMIRIRDLDPSLLPGGPGDPHGRRRLVFVGDVHGCRKELSALLDQVRFNQDTDHLVLVGDTVSKGPDNVGVLDELIRLNATSVRGNHEDQLLHLAQRTQLLEPTRTRSKGKAKDLALVRQLKPHHLAYLRDMPLMLHIPVLPLASGPSNTAAHSPIAERMLVVHAGLVPGVPLDRQDPYFVMNMRSIDPRTHVPSALRSPSPFAKPWYEVWGRYNGRLLQPHSPSAPEEAAPQVVVYGHDSKAGLQIHPWSKGLDSGCVGGGALTAMVVDARGQQKLCHVACEGYLNT